MDGALRRVRYGITLPVFGRTAGDAIEAARLAEELGFDAVFAFDHLRPPGDGSGAEGLECFSLLGAVAAATSSIEVGSLVVKAWLRPPEVNAQAFGTLQEISHGRVVAGLGVSDRLSSAEVEAYSLDFPTREARIEALVRTAELLEARGISRIWIGGHSRPLLEAAASRGECVNLWNAPPERIEEVSSALEAAARARGRQRPPGITWGGDLARVRREPGLLRQVLAFGPEYVIISAPGPEDVASAADLVAAVDGLGRRPST